MKSYFCSFSVGPGWCGFKYFDRVHFNLHQLVYVRASEEENIQEESL